MTQIPDAPKIRLSGGSVIQVLGIQIPSAYYYYQSSSLTPLFSESFWCFESFHLSFLLSSAYSCSWLPRPAWPQFGSEEKGFLKKIVPWLFKFLVSTWKQFILLYPICLGSHLWDSVLTTFYGFQFSFMLTLKSWCIPVVLGGVLILVHTGSVGRCSNLKNFV